jgi:hypothetical protein
MDNKVLAMQRLQDFLASANRTSTNMSLSPSYQAIIEASRYRMTKKLADFDKAFNNIATGK